MDTSTFLSDHAALHCVLDVGKPDLGRQEFTYRKFKSIDHESFADALRSSDIILHPATDLEGLCNQFDASMIKILDEQAPLKKCVAVVRPINSWFSDDIADAKRHRRRLETKWRSSRLTVDRERFTIQRLAVSSMITEAKRKHFEEQLSDCSNQREVYKVVNKMLHQGKQSKLPSHASDRVLAVSFNEFFMTKIDDIRADLDAMALHSSDAVDQINRSILQVSDRTYPRLEHFDPTSEDEIQRIIARSPSTFSTHDPLPTWLMKKHLNIILPTITLIVNRSLELGVFPDSFKKASVVPILKKPNLDPEVLHNYRPVSNLTFISKVLERVVAHRLQGYLDQHKLSEPLQSAYKKKHSTESALVKVHNDILLALDSKQAVFLVLLDLSAAFDTIDQNVLIQRFQSLGIEGSAIKWIASYLRNRTQSVRINNAMSSESELKYGVPQGSVLGPSFFSVYAGPLADIARSHNIEVHLYADDTQLYTSFNPSDPHSEVSARTRMEACIGDMKLWMTHNKLKLNDNKSEFMIIVPKRQACKINCQTMRIGNVDVIAKSSVRNLGVSFDSEMTMSSNINATCRAAYYHIRNISSIRKSLSDRVAASVIHSYVVSRLDYGNALLYGVAAGQLTKLQRVQNAAARVLTRTSKFSHITPILRELHWLPVRERVKYKIILLTWKSINGLAPQYLQDCISEYNPPRQLRSSGCSMLTPRRVRLGAGEKAFSFSAPLLWNNLPLDLRIIKSIDVFKVSLKTYLFRSAFE